MSTITAPRQTTAPWVRDQLHIQTCVRHFGEKFVTSEQYTEQAEIARRNVLLGTFVLAKTPPYRGHFLTETLNAVTSDVAAWVGPQDADRDIDILTLIASPAVWHKRHALLFANVQPTSPARRALLPSALELLDSLDAAEGRYQHDLTVTIP